MVLAVVLVLVLVVLVVVVAGWGLGLPRLGQRWADRAPLALRVLAGTGRPTGPAAGLEQQAAAPGQGLTTSQSRRWTFRGRCGLDSRAAVCRDRRWEGERRHAHRGEARRGEEKRREEDI